MNEPGLDADRWLRIKELFADAASRAPAERVQFLADACPDDAAMRQEVEALLSSHDEAGDFFERRKPAVAALANARVPLPVAVCQLAPGRRLGPYEIVAQLGAGGMGEVYRAHDTNLGRDIAIKILPTFLALDGERLLRFRREARALASLNHPHVAAIYGFEETDGIPALILELVEGPTLAERVAQGRIPIDEALGIARQIAEAIAAAHAKGIIHRDLKPANIKIAAGGMVKVLDFGLAKALSGEDSDLSKLPTITADKTGERILGTPA
jgi:serine/threonine protein kinase